MSSYMERIYQEIYFFNADIIANLYTRFFEKLMYAYLDKNYPHLRIPKLRSHVHESLH